MRRKKRTNKENSISSSAHRYSHNQSRSHTATVIVSPRYFIVIASAKSFRLRWKCRNSVWWASGSEGVRAREKESERGQEGKLYLCVHCTCCHLNPSLFKWINSVVLSIVWTIENCNIKPDACESEEAHKYVLFRDSYTCKWIENGMFYILCTGTCHKIKMASQAVCAISRSDSRSSTAKRIARVRVWVGE